MSAPAPTISLTCKRHPEGTDQPCAACGRARIAYEEWVVQAAKPQPRYDPTVYCNHLQLRGKCWMCEEESKRADLEQASA